MLVADFAPAVSRVTTQPILLVLLALSLACKGDSAGPSAEPATPLPSGPGFTLSVQIPGIVDSTIRGDSLYWTVFGSADDSVPHPDRELLVQLLVLDPPPPLESPLVFKLRWSALAPRLPALGRYRLQMPPAPVWFVAESNVGAWAATTGTLQLTTASDSVLVARITATLVPVYPANSGLPTVVLHGAFWAPSTQAFGPTP
jgi:hypothetical protein